MSEARLTRPLRAMADVDLGRQRSPDRDHGPNMVPYLRAANVKDGRLELADVKEMDFSPPEQRTFGLAAGDVLVSEGAGSLAAVGASSVWSGEIPGVICYQNTLLRLRPHPGNDPRYLMWWARHAYGSGLFASIATGANIYHLGAERVRVLPAWIPSLGEQRAIAGYLDAETRRIDALVLSRRRQVDLIHERLGSAIEGLALGAVARSRGTVASGYYGSRPVGWSETTLRHLSIAVQTGPFGSQLHAEEYIEGGVPIVNPMHLADGRIVPSAGMTVTDNKALELSRHELAEGDVVVARRGELGRVAVVNEASAGFLCGTGCVRLRPRNSAMRSGYLAMLLSSAPLRAYFETASVGSTMDNLSAETLLAAPVLVPPADEQADIEAEVRRTRLGASTFIETMSCQVELLLERRQALITAAVTGQLEMSRVAA